MLRMLKHLSVVGILILSLFLISPSYSIPNPAAVYCKSLGYNYTSKETPEGTVGICVFPDNSSADAWNFLLGREALNWSYCTINGYGVEHLENSDICKECTACVLKNGTKVEVTKLMDLNFMVGRCGDGVCTIGENYGNCEKDCPSGGEDNYCDGVKDGICDPDCFFQETPEKDVDCSFCGDGKCDKKENYKNCSKDCPSGSKDNYCDGVEDNICDPDCRRNLDQDCLCNKDGICEPNYENYENCPEDCKKPMDFMPIFIIIGIVVAIILVVLLLKKHSSKEERMWKEIYYGVDDRI